MTLWTPRWSALGDHRRRGGVFGELEKLRPRAYKPSTFSSVLHLPTPLALPLLLRCLPQRQSPWSLALGGRLLGSTRSRPSDLSACAPAPHSQNPLGHMHQGHTKPKPHRKHLWARRSAQSFPVEQVLSPRSAAPAPAFSSMICPGHRNDTSRHPLSLETAIRLRRLTCRLMLNGRTLLYCVSACSWLAGTTYVLHLCMLYRA